MQNVVIIGYWIIAGYFAWKWLSGRSEWLDKPEIGPRVVKFGLSYLLGGIFGVVLFMIVVLKAVNGRR